MTQMLFYDKANSDNIRKREHNSEIKKELTIDICNNSDEPPGHYVIIFLKIQNCGEGQ